MKSSCGNAFLGHILLVIMTPCSWQLAAQCRFQDFSILGLGLVFPMYKAASSTRGDSAQVITSVKPLSFGVDPEPLLINRASLSASPWFPAAWQFWPRPQMNSVWLPPHPAVLCWRCVTVSTQIGFDLYRQFMTQDI